jgi:omega-6 fatty acid desaturase (delta-12 desaturase)
LGKIQDTGCREAAAPDARTWAQILARYYQPSTVRGIFEIAITVVPLAALWALAWATLHISYWLALPLVVLAAAFLVRLFMIQHDCSHGSFFRSKVANEWVGRVAGVLTLTPFHFWRRSHTTHHATCGNLERRGMGDIDTLTIAEYRALPLLGRLRYRIYRHPLVLFGIGPAFQFIVVHRLPVGMMRDGWKPWLSTMATNLAAGAIAAALIWAIGLKAFLLVHTPIIMLAASIGVWLFYVQHQFERTTWDDEKAWDFHDAALHGSSHYDLPGLLRWFTANIGVHHVHHLYCRIPSYRLRHVLRDHPELNHVGRLTLWESFRCVRLALWDETQRRLVSFKEASHKIRAAA